MAAFCCFFCATSLAASRSSLFSCAWRVEISRSAVVTCFSSACSEAPIRWTSSTRVTRSLNDPAPST